jgi:ABC-type multidrug transport system fused ATPase/permease subunit
MEGIVQQIKDDNTSPSMLRLLARLYAREWRGTGVAVACGIATAVLTTLGANVNRTVVDRFAAHAALGIPVFVWIALLIGAGILNAVSGWVTYRVGRSITGTLVCGVVRHLSEQTLDEFEASIAKDRQTLVTRLTAQVATTLSTGLSWTIAVAGPGLGALVGMVAMNWRWSLFTFPLVVASGWGAAWMTRRGRARVAAQAVVEQRRSKVLREICDPARFAVLIRNHLTDAFAEEFEELTRKYDGMLDRGRAARAKYSFGVRTGPALVAPVVWLVASSSGASAGMVVAFAALMFPVISGITGISDLVADMADAEPYLIEAANLTAMPTTARETDPEITPARLAGKPLVFSGACVSRGGRPVLRGLDLKIPQGQWLAVVGPSGGGKTLLFKAMTRLVFVDGEGTSACIGDDQIARTPRGVLAQHVGMVDSTPTTFEGTARRNVTLIVADAPTELIQWACDVAQFPIDRLDAQAAQLSTGQRARLQIVQVLLTKPKILILDEILTHVDPMTRAAIRAALRRELPDTTIIEVSHAGAVTFPELDRIVVLDGGQIVASGLHRELLASSHVYRDFVAAAARQ